MLDKLMGGDGLLDKKIKFWGDDNIENNDEEDNDLYAIYSSQETTDEQYDSMSSIVSIQKKPKPYTMIVFSETFFSNRPPLDNASVYQIINLCKILTKKYTSLIICINFLHRFDAAETMFPFWLSPDKSFNPPQSEDFIYAANDYYKAKLISKGNQKSFSRFSNYSLVIWNGVSISCYRKTVYLEEQDSLIDHGYGFDFGDWNSYSTIELRSASQEHQEFAELFNMGNKQAVITRICADLSNMPNVPNSVRLLMIQANSAPPGWLEKFKNSTICCYCDADPGSGGCALLSKTVKGKVIQTNATEIETCSFMKNKLHCSAYKCGGHE
jgi:hypothetical protein